MTKKMRRIGDGSRIDIPASECAIELSTGLPDKVKDKRGVRKDRLVAQEFAGFQLSGTRKRAIWLCVCDCGNTICTVILPSSKVYSCGCLNREVHTTHGSRMGEWDVKTAESQAYRVWLSQIRHCYNPNSSSYPTVGGRGIKMCDRWVNDFSAFLEDVGYPPTAQHVLARLDDDKDFELSNVRWMPKTEHSKEIHARSVQQKSEDKPQPSDDQLRMLVKEYPDASAREYSELLAAATGIHISRDAMGYRLKKLGLSRKKPQPSNDQLMLIVKEYPDASIPKYCELLAAATGIRISQVVLLSRLQKLGLSRKDQRSANDGATAQYSTRKTKGRWKVGDGARVDIPASECAIELSTGLPDKVKDKRGIRQGRLVVQEFAGFYVRRTARAAVWLCVCDCGNTIRAKIAPTATVYSCGCLFREVNTTHGAEARKDGVRSAESPVYSAWRCQIESCYHSHSRKYPNTGGRGIKMCDRWVTDFAAFLEDVGYPPTPRHVLARLDYDKDYEPSNVRWMPRTEHTEKNIAHRLLRYKDKPQPSDDQLRMLVKKYPDASARDYCKLLAAATGIPISRSNMFCRLQKLGLSRKEQKPSDDQLRMFAQRYPDATGREYCELIAKETGVRINRSHLSVRMRKLGLSREEQKLSDDQLRMFAQRYPDATGREYCELITKEAGIRISRSTVQLRLQKLGLSRKEQRYAMFNV